MKTINRFILLLTAFAVSGIFFAGCKKQTDFSFDAIAPRKVLITKITVTGFPATDDDGAAWDSTGGADIYPAVFNGTVLLWASADVAIDANPAIDYDFIPGTAVELLNPNGTYSIDLYDDDTGSIDNFMGGIYFTPYNSATGTPPTVTVDAGGGALSFILHLEYVY